MTLRVCPFPGCPTLTAGGYCWEHRRQADQQRGTRQQRGYDRDHDRLRAHWAAVLAHRVVPCARCGKPITAGQAWHLDHDEDRRYYLGPSHAWCNNSAGGRAAHR